MRAGEVIDDRYLLEQRVGSGGMGTVWRAKDSLTSAGIAIKVLRDPDHGDPSRFLREAKILAQLKHPNIVEHVGHGITEGGVSYLAMEWLDGEDLATRLSRGALSLDESLDLVLRVAGALSAAHSAGVVHRDIKPSNLFLAGQDAARVKVLDFGIARQTGLTGSITRQSLVLGTPGYMAPEQARGAAEVGPPADIFSLGCVLFECLAGRAAFQGGHPMALLAKLLLEEAPRLHEVRPDVPLVISELCEQMLSKEPEKRPPSGAALCLALVGIDISAPSNSSAPRSQVPSRISRVERRHISIIAISRGGPAEALSPTEGATATRQAQAPRLLDEAQRIASQLGARADILADGTILIVLFEGTPSDQAARAGRAALELSGLAPSSPIALVTGRSDVTDRLPVGALVDRAADLLQEAADKQIAAVVLGDETLALIGARFEASERDNLFLLERERASSEEGRTLLGKPSPFVGRDRELRNLVEMLTEAFEERAARSLLVTGAAGAGKSRLRQELSRPLKERFPDLVVSVGRAGSLGRGAAFAPLATGLRDAMGIEVGEPAEVQQEKVFEAVREVVSAERAAHVAAFLGELMGAPFPEKRAQRLRAARQNAGLMAEEMQAAYIDFLRGLAQKGPTLLVLEDLHWGDASSVKLVDASLRELREEPFAVIAFARPEVHEVFPRLWSDRNTQEIRLGPLPRRAAEALVRAALGPISEAELRRILDQSEGNAFYLEELVRAAEEGRGGELPETVLGMVEARLAALPADARRLLRAASVYGEIFWKNAALALFGKDKPPNFGETVSYLVERELITPRSTRRFSGEEEYAFRHALIREAAYAMLTARDKSVGHNLAGAWLERVNEPDPALLAMHFELGQSKARAAAWHARAAQRAMRGYDLPTALGAVDKGLTAISAGDTAAELWALRARITSTAGDFNRSLEAAEEALRIARRGSAAFCLALEGALASATVLGKTASLRAHTSSLLDIEPDPEGISALARAFAPAVVALAAGGQKREARALLARMQEIMAGRMEREPSGAGSLTYASAAWEHYVMRRPYASLKLGRESVRYLELGGEGHIIAVATAAIGASCIALGAFEEAEEHLSFALQHSRPGSLAMYVTNGHLARLHYERGELAEARVLAEALLEQSRERGEGVATTTTRVTYVDACVALGELDAAEASIHVLMAAGERIPMMAAWAQRAKANVLLKRGQPAEALLAAKEAFSICEELEVAPPEPILLTRVEALLAAGEEPAFREALRSALAELRFRAEWIEDPAYRDSFLDVLPFNARLRALGREWLGGV